MPEILTRFDQRFDILFEKIRDQTILIGERTSEYLNWRLIDSPIEDYILFSLVHKKTQEIGGYITFYKQNNIACIVDFIALDAHKMFDIVFSEFLMYQRREGADAVSLLYFGKSFFRNKLREYGFVVRPPLRDFVVYLNPEINCPIDLENPEYWYVLECDNDI